MKLTITIAAALVAAAAPLTPPCAAQSPGSPQNAQGGGNVLPGTATPSGDSLTEMAKLLALFNTSGNNSAYYPDTRFQILYANFATVDGISCPADVGGTGIAVTGGNTSNFVVKSGTPFFVPMSSFDNSPPVVGSFPADSSGAANYVFGPAGYGARDFSVIVDGASTPVGAEYLAGPVNVPGLLDGGGDSLIQLGVFLTPMSPGTHTVRIMGEIASQAIQAAYEIGCIAQDYTYTVTVVPGEARMVRPANSLKPVR